MPGTVGTVLPTSSPGEIAQPIIGGITVDVAAFLTGWTRSYERL